MSDENGKRETDPAKLAQLLEIELMQKRAEWQRSKTRRGSLRALSFLFLFLIIAAAAVAFFLFLSPERVDQLRATGHSSTPTPSASVAP